MVAMILCFEKVNNDFENFKKFENILKFLSFLKQLHVKLKNPYFSQQSPIVQPLSF